MGLRPEVMSSIGRADHRDESELENDNRTVYSHLTSSIDMNLLNITNKLISIGTLKDSGGIMYGAGQGRAGQGRTMRTENTTAPHGL
jgi:hypothetical protein